MFETNITADYYWDVMLREAIKASSYLPKDLYYLITTSKDLEKMITPSIVYNWYEDEQNLDCALEEIIYTRRIRTSYFTQSANISDLEECIKRYYGIIEFETQYDEQATVVTKKQLKREVIQNES